jgi:hypothetical protein
VECGVWSVEFGVWSVECGVWIKGCSLCSLLCASVLALVQAGVPAQAGVSTNIVLNC